ncbi:MAG: glycosyltransferase [Candidatus Scalindua sp.]|nr:glycosyltransferase [Candidatus Scalindua sp.]
MNISVIIPAHNASDTLAETLESILKQTSTNWEAIVVDDGSSDETAAVAREFIDKDNRFRITRRQQGGESAARNTGITLASYDWLLFLDADDWISPDYLERMTGKLVSDSTLDAVHCGWIRVAPDGTYGDEIHCPQTGDLFSLFTRYCVFAIHACIVRRSLVESVGNFDTLLRTCPDWDMWQRIARTGACFGTVPEALAFYRMRPDSASMNVQQILADGLRVINQGHSPDPRVLTPDPLHINGSSSEQLSRAILQFICWTAGLMIGQKEDARPLLRTLTNERDPELDPHIVAQNIYQATLLPVCKTSYYWIELWAQTEQHIINFLLELEVQSKAFGLARRVRTILERMILDNATTLRPVTVGTTYGFRIDVTEPISDISLSAPIERLHCTVELDGTHIGTIEIPVCDGMIFGYILSDAIANEFSWTVIGRFFERTIYPNLIIKQESNGFSIWRGTVCLAESVLEEEQVIKQQMHKFVGWSVFLQEIWGCYNQPIDSFYTVNGETPLKKSIWIASIQEFFKHRAWPYTNIFRTIFASRQSSSKGWIRVEVSEELHNMKASARKLNVVLTVGGVIIGIVTIPVKHNTVYAHELLVALTGASGYELCNIAVREGLLGKSMTGQTSLRERLAVASANVNQFIQNCSDPAEFKDIAFAPGSVFLRNRTLFPIEHCMILCRRLPMTIGTSASRHAMLPAAATRELFEAASDLGEHVIKNSDLHENPMYVIYAPDVILPGYFNKHLSSKNLIVSRTTHSESSAISSKNHKIVNSETDRLPILMYHRVSPAGSAATTRYRVTPEAFKEQIQYLHDAGFYSISLEDWHTAMVTKKPLPGRPILITFDDGYLDFSTFAWPVLRSYGFTATVFIVTDEVGGSNRWDSIFEEQIPLLDWNDIRLLHSEGVEFGSHSTSHPYLTALPAVEVVREGARSRGVLGRELGITVKSFAYPHGAEDRVVQHLIGACGYIYGLSCRWGLSSYEDPLLALPRLEVFGSDILYDFIGKLDRNSRN